MSCEIFSLILKTNKISNLMKPQINHLKAILAGMRQTNKWVREHISIYPPIVSKWHSPLPELGFFISLSNPFKCKNSPILSLSINNTLKIS